MTRTGIPTKLPFDDTSSAAQLEVRSSGTGRSSLVIMKQSGRARRNVLVGPGFVNLDFSIYKNTAFLSDRFTTQFRVEFFNVLNHTNCQGPLSNNVLFDQTGAPVAGAGALTQTTHDSREIQIALKLLW